MRFQILVLCNLLWQVLLDVGMSCDVDSMSSVLFARLSHKSPPHRWTHQRSNRSHEDVWNIFFKKEDISTLHSHRLSKPDSTFHPQASFDWNLSSDKLASKDSSFFWRHLGDACATEVLLRLKRQFLVPRQPHCHTQCSTLLHCYTATLLHCYNATLLHCHSAQPWRRCCCLFRVGKCQTDVRTLCRIIRLKSENMKTQPAFQ